jgi:hypothetical protein
MIIHSIFSLESTMNCLSHDGDNTEVSLIRNLLFSFEKISDFDTVAFSFLFDKHCLIID